MSSLANELPLLLPSADEIDHYGERLIGCIECNRWGKHGDKTLVMEMLEDDLEALRESRKAPR